jgi:Ca2+-binding EF-hand superfamily protein
MSRLSAALRNTLLVATAGVSGAPSLAQERPNSDGLTAWTRVVMEATFSKADANEDGRLSRSEAARLAAFSERFDALDSNGDGSLDLEEFAAGFATAA